MFNLILSQQANTTTIMEANDHYGSEDINTKDVEHKNRLQAFYGGAQNISIPLETESVQISFIFLSTI